MIHGLCAYPITPADARGRVDVAAMRRLVAPLVSAGVDAIGVLGSTGTYMYLSAGERRRALEAALDEAGGRVPVLAGVGALRTDEAVGFARDAAAAGASAGLLAPVSYTPLTEDEVYEHFAAVAREGGLPLCVYDNPATTRFHVTPALLGRLARLPAVVGSKHPATEAADVAAQFAALRAAAPPGFSLGTSVDWHAAAALEAGADAWHGVAAGLFPTACLALMRAAQRGDGVALRQADGRLAPLWRLFRDHSSLRVAYAAASLGGLVAAEPPRPVLPLPAPVRREVAGVMEGLSLG